MMSVACLLLKHFHNSSTLGGFFGGEAIHCHCDCTKHSSNTIISFGVTIVFSSGSWRHGMLGGRRTCFMYLGSVSVLVGYTGAYQTKTKY